MIDTFTMNERALQVAWNITEGDMLNEDYLPTYREAMEQVVRDELQGVEPEIIEAVLSHKVCIEDTVKHILAVDKKLKFYNEMLRTSGYKFRLAPKGVAEIISQPNALDEDTRKRTGKYLYVWHNNLSRIYHNLFTLMSG
jgi:hypothetical protein